MASTREIRQRIKSVKATAQITRAMQLVAAAKMRKAQEAALSGKQYGQVMSRVLASLSGNIDPSMHPLLTQHDEGTAAVIFLSSDRGLAGAFNTNLLREAEKLPQAHYITIGKKGRDYIVKTKKELQADFSTGDAATFALAKQLTKLVLDDYINKKVNKVLLLYTDFINTLNQKPRVLQLLPIQKEALLEFAMPLQAKKQEITQTEVMQREYVFEPAADQLLDYVLRHFVEMTIYQVLLESAASEQSARMMAMKNATDNAQELVGDLTLTYNQVRQGNITKELLEITTAAMALE